MRRELDAILAARVDVPRTVEELQKRILSKLGRAWAESPDDERRVRKQKLAKVGGFTSFEKLMNWAKEQAP